MRHVDVRGLRAATVEPPIDERDRGNHRDDESKVGQAGLARRGQGYVPGT